MARLRGRAIRGEHCRAGVPHGHWWKTTTFTGALRLTGMPAPFVYEGAVNGNVFLAYVEQVLLPTLQPGDIVVMDMCGCPRLCKKKSFEEQGAWSGADMASFETIQIQAHLHRAPGTRSSPDPIRLCLLPTWTPPFK